MDGNSGGEAWRTHLQELGLGNAPGAEVQLVNTAPWTKLSWEPIWCPCGCMWCCYPTAGQDKGVGALGGTGADGLIPSVRRQDEDEGGFLSKGSHTFQDCPSRGGGGASVWALLSTPP